MAALVGNDPKTGGDETCPEGIQRPESELGSAVEDRVWELNNLRVDTGIKESGGLVDSSQGDNIRDPGGIYASEMWASEQKKKVPTRKGRNATRSS